MAHISLASLRGRLFLLIFLAVVPALVAILYSAAEERRLARTQVQENTLRLVRLAASEQGRFFQNTHQLLATLAHWQVVRDHEETACSALLAELSARYSLYAHLSVSTSDGDVFCNARPSSGPLNLSSFPWFQRTVQSRDFTIGEYQVDPVSDRFVLVVSYPVLDDAGAILGVAAASLDLTWLSQAVSSASLPTGAVFTAVDRTGTIILRYPDPEKWVGRNYRHAPIVQTMLTQSEGMGEIPGLDETPHLHAFTPVKGLPDVGMYINIGIPTDIAFADVRRRLVRNLLLWSAVVALALLASWFGSELLILRSVKRLMTAVERVSTGDLSVRTGPPYEEGELGKLARAFDAMAGSLEQREQERRQDEKTLKASAARYRSLFDNAFEGIFRSIPDGRFTHVNPALVRMLGYDSAEEVLALRLPDDLYSDPTQRTRLQALYNPLGTVNGIELLWKKRNGEPLIVTLYAKALRDTQGSILAYEGMVLDITERKRAAEELQREAQVSAALARVGRELIGSLDKATLLDRLCQIVTEVVACDCSHALLWQPRERLYRVVASYGHSPEQTEMLRELKVTAETLGPLLAQLADEEVARDVAVMRDLPVTVLARQFGLTHALYVALRRGGELIGLQTAAYRTQQKSFTEQQIRILQGIGQLASLALEDARLLEELRQANRLKSDFLATMSHELRTPLNIIIGYADLLLEEEFGVLTSGQHSSLQRIRKATEGELELITALLDVSRLEAGRLPVEQQEVRVEELLNELAAEAEELLREKPRVTSAWQVAPGLPVLYTDRTKLKVVLKNLLGNAIKFTDEGHVAVTASAWDGGVKFAVSDTGIGIAPEVQAVMFGMFRQGDSSPTRRYAGVGLGLYITLQLLALLGGTISVESKVAQGSTFYVWLPAAGGTARQRA